MRRVGQEAAGLGVAGSQDGGAPSLQKLEDPKPRAEPASPNQEVLLILLLWPQPFLSWQHFHGRILPKGRKKS